MAKTKLTEYDATAANNLDIDSISLAENVMVPSDVNNALRELMAHLKDFAAGTEAVNAIAVDNLKLDGNTISSTDTNGNILISPNGTGNVGIGTSSPTSELTIGAVTPQVDFYKTSSADVLANIRAETDAGSGGKLVIQTKRNGDTAIDRVTIDDDGAIHTSGNLYTSDYYYIGNDAGTGTGINTGWQTLSGGSGYLLTYVNGAERMRIDSSGNVYAKAEGGSANIDLRQGSVKAWVNFNGTGTIAARDSLNLSSLTDNSVGNYTINFVNALNNNDYSSLSASRARMTGSADTYSATTSKRIEMYDSAGSADDTDSVNFGLLGDLA